MDKFIEILNSTGIPIVYTTENAGASLPFISYMEYSEKYGYADNKIESTIIKIQVDYYTTAAFDKNKDLIKNTLSVNKIPFEYKLLFDSDERVYHHIFDCEVI